MLAAKDMAASFHAVPHDLATTVVAFRGQSMNRALEGVESMFVAADGDLKRFVVVVMADFADSHVRLLGSSPLVAL
jgi:hypothetical protein